MTDRMLVFISGPVSRNLTQAEMRFSKAARGIWTLGHEPLNPVELVKNAGLREAPWAEQMSFCFGLIAKSDALLLLPGWNECRGSPLEKAFAEAIPIPVLTREQAIKEWGDEA